jgi:hypothetical protein
VVNPTGDLPAPVDDNVRQLATTVVGRGVKWFLPHDVCGVRRRVSLFREGPRSAVDAAVAYPRPTATMLIPGIAGTREKGSPVRRAVWKEVLGGSAHPRGARA